MRPLDFSHASKFCVARKLDGWVMSSRSTQPSAWGLSASMSSALAPTLPRSEEQTSELQSLMRISYAVFCLKTKNKKSTKTTQRQSNQQYTIVHQSSQCTQ